MDVSIMATGAVTSDIRFLLLPLPEFALLPFGGFLDKLRFSADDEDYSRQRYCSWTIMGLEPGHVLSSSGAAVQVEAKAADIHFADYDYLVVFGGRSARATEALAPNYKRLLRAAAGQGVKLHRQCQLSTGRLWSAHRPPGGAPLAP